MNCTNRYRAQGVWTRIAMVMAVGLLAAHASAARLGHPAYSASGATASQTQWNLICDPTNAVSGSTSTLYDPTVANINTINAFPGYQLNEVDVLINDGEGTFVDQFVLPAGTTSFVILHGEASVAAVGSAPGSTYFAFLSGPEAGAVQVFWSPLVSTDATPATAAKTNGNAADVNTHTITFDNVSGNPKAVATFTNYANGNTNFPVYFPTPDQYSGPGFVYTAQQIQSATVKLKLKQDGDDQHPNNSKDDKTGH